MHVAPSEGKSRDVSGAVVDMLFPEELGNARIPIMAITGTNGKTTTVRLTDFICRFAGKLTGYTSTDWVKVNNELIDAVDYSVPTGHQFVLNNKKVKIALLESARGVLLKRGLIESYVNGTALTNVSADPLGEDGIETVA